MYRDAQQPMEDEHEVSGGLRGFFGRWSDRIRGVSDDEEEGYEEPAAPSHHASAHHGARSYTAPSSGSATASTQREAPRHTFRIASSREGSISVMPVSGFADIQKAADRLKAGEPQIINLEKTPPEVSERLIDFLNGVTYALEGYVEKVSEGAYLFTPSYIAIHADGPEPPQPKSPFFDR